MTPAGWIIVAAAWLLWLAWFAAVQWRKSRQPRTCSPAHRCPECRP